MTVRRPFSDRYVFAKVMQDNPDLCKELIERILNIKVRNIKSLQVEAETATIVRRSVRFDVFLDSDEAAFEVEMQTYEQRDLPKRMRYYRAQLDHLLLKRGAAYDELKPVYIIFFCTVDPFGSGLAMYTFRNVCLEATAVHLEDEAVNIVLNTSGDLSRVGPGVASLLQYVGTNVVNNDDALTGRLQEAVGRAYDDEEWVSDMSWLDWDIRDARREAQRQGRELGLEEGKAEGRAEQHALQSELIAAMKSAGVSSDEILAALAEGDTGELCQKYGIPF